MPRLSLWKDGKHSNDFKFMDRRISEMFTIGGTGIHVHKYLGTVSGTGDSGDATKPNYTNQSEQNIQDLLFLENRDRKYEPDVYNLRGIYQRQDSDFDLTQFGLFLQTGTIFMVFHIRDMVDTIGRRLMSGDVLELEHLKDYDGQIGDVPAALKRYYVVGDASFASEGFTPTWWPHLWRVKLNPMVDSQEYKDILNTIKVDTDGDGIGDTPIANIVSTYNKYLEINDAIIQQAEIDVPKSGYDTSPIYHKPLTPDGKLGEVYSVTADNNGDTGDDVNSTADMAPLSADSKVKGYLSGDGLGPNGVEVQVGINFPGNPSIGEYFLRTDYLPNRLFRYNGSRWVKIEDSVRTNLTPNTDTNATLRNSFTHNVDNAGNLKTYTDSTGTVHYERQSLSKALTPKADN
jgi:hypothetical protein